MNIGRLQDRDGRAINVGDTVKDFRGESHVVDGWEREFGTASSGHVHTHPADGGDWQDHFYPSVFNLEIVRGETTCVEHPDRPVSAADPDKIRCATCVLYEGAKSGFTVDEVELARAELMDDWNRRRAAGKPTVEENRWEDRTHRLNI